MAQVAEVSAETLVLSPSALTGTAALSGSDLPNLTPVRIGVRLRALLRSRPITKAQALQPNTRSDNSMRGLAFVPQLLHLWVASLARRTITLFPAFVACHIKIARNWLHPVSEIDLFSPVWYLFLLLAVMLFAFRSSTPAEVMGFPPTPRFGDAGVSHQTWRKDRSVAEGSSPD